MRAWIDTDVGTNPDDGAALLVALAHPGIEVVGVSTVSGHTAVRAAVARAYLGGTHVPVVAGHGTPRPGGPEPRWLGHEAAGLTEIQEEQASAGALIEAVNRACPDVLIALGPLTNVALLVEHEAPPHRIVAMAGVHASVWHRGELVEVDHNVASDPAAANTVREAARQLLEVPLDVTVQMRLGDRDAAALASRHERLGHEVAEWLARTGSVTLHDPLAVLAAVPEEHAGIGLQCRREGPGRVTANHVDGVRAVRRVMQLLHGRNGTEPR